MEKRVLFLQPDRLVSYCPGDSDCGEHSYKRNSGQYFVDMQWMINGDQLPEQLLSYLENNLHAEFSLVFDLPEEECYRDELKAVGIRDRKHVVERLKNKRFENSLFSRAIISGSGANRLLLTSGVDSNVLCENLIAGLKSTGISLRSIHSVTTLTPRIAKQEPGKNSALLVIIPLHGCYRLVACAGQSVLFTRRVSASAGFDSDSNNEDYRALNQSIEETLLYVQRLQELWQPSIIFIGDSAVANKLKYLRSSLITSSQVAEIKSYWPVGYPVDAKTAVEPMLASEITLAGIGYAQKTHRRVYVSHKIRSVCAALALCGFAGAGMSVAVANKLNSAQGAVAENYSQSASTLKSDVAHLESTYDQPVEAVRQALIAARLLELSSQEPFDFLQTLAPSVHQQPDISISSVRWETEANIDETLLVNLQEPPETLESISLEKIYRVTLAGVVKGKPDSAFSQFESFVSALRVASKDPSIVVVETPFGLGEKRRTSGSDYSALQGEFVLEISNESVAR